MQSNAATAAPEGRKRKGTAALALILILCLAVGGALAYLTDAKQIVNNLVLDTDLRIELTEPEWDAAREADPTYAKNLVPTETAVKDPTVTCTGTVPAYAAVKVCVPVFTGKVFDQAAGTIEDMSDADLFSIAWEDGWVLKETSEAAGGFRTYTYLWPDVLNKGESAKVFGSVTVANLIEGVGIDATQITVDAFGIQAGGFEDADAAWAGYMHQEGDGAGEGPEPGPDDPIEIPEQTSGLSAAKVNDAVPASATKVVFTTAAQPTGTDLSIEGDGSYTGSTSGTTYTIARAEGGYVELPADSSGMLAGKEKLATVDLSGADSSGAVRMDGFMSNTALASATTGDKWDVSGLSTSRSFMPRPMADSVDGAYVGTEQAFTKASATYALAAERGGAFTLSVSKLTAAGTSSPLTNRKAIAFTDEAAPAGTSTKDLSLEGDGSVVGFALDGIYRISTQVEGQPVIAPMDMENAFSRATAAASIDLSALDTSRTVSMAKMFSGCKALASIDLTALDTSNVTSMMGMFWNCTSLASVDLASLDTSSVTDMSWMFNGCKALADINTAGADTRRVFKADCMIQNCTALQLVDMSGCDMRVLRTAGQMFRGCAAVTEVMLPTFSAGQYVCIEGMFEECGELQTIYAAAPFSNEKRTGGSSEASVFAGCTKLVGGAGTAYTEYSGGKGKKYACIDDPENGQPGYFTRA